MNVAEQMTFLRFEHLQYDAREKLSIELPHFNKTEIDSSPMEFELASASKKRINECYSRDHKFYNDVIDGVR